MKRTLVGMALAATFAGGLFTAAPASAQCYFVPGVGCVNPCTAAHRAVYDTTGRDLPGECTM